MLGGDRNDIIFRNYRDNDGFGFIRGQAIRDIESYPHVTCNLRFRDTKLRNEVVMILLLYYKKGEDAIC